MADEIELSVSEQGEVLQAFSQTLDREAHTLIKRPDLLWQQLFNRLQWEEGSVKKIVSEKKRQHSINCKNWVRTRMPLQESDELIRTLEGHTEAVNSVAISPDGGWIVSASSDCTLKIWDSSSGIETQTLNGHSSDVTSVAVSPDSAFIVSGSYDKTLKIWDAKNGQELHSLTGHTGYIQSVIISPDCKCV